MRVSLCSKLHARLCRRIEKDLGVIARVLRLDEAIKLRVLGSLLAEDGVPQGRRLRLEVGRRVLLCLTVLNRDRKHVLLGRRIELLARIDDLIRHVLLRTFALLSKEGSDGCASEFGADPSAARRAELFKHGGVVLPEPTGVQLDRPTASLEPHLAPKDGLGGGNERKREDTELED